MRNPEFYRRSKHTDVRYQFICKKTAKKCNRLFYVSTNSRYANVLMKALSGEKFTVLRTNLIVIERALQTLK